MKKLFVILSVAGLTALGACSVSASDQEHLGLSAAYDLYISYCGSHTGATGCTQVNEKEAKDAYNLASKAIDDFASGTITKAQEQALIQRALKIFNDFMNQ